MPALALQGQHKGFCLCLCPPGTCRPPAKKCQQPRKGSELSSLARGKSPPRAEQQQLGGLEFSKHRDITTNHRRIDIASHIQHRYSPPRRPNPPSLCHSHQTYPPSFSRRLISTTFFLALVPEPTPRIHRQSSNGWRQGQIVGRKELGRQDVGQRWSQEAAEPLCPRRSPG